MKIPVIAIFLTIVLSIYTLTNWYIYAKTSVLFETTSLKTFGLKLIFWIIVFAYPVARILERFVNNATISFLVKIGSFWMGAMLYLFLFFLVIDLLRAINYFIPFIGFLNYKANPQFRVIIAKSVYIISFVVLLIAFLNAHFPRINHFEVNLKKSLSNNSPLRIVAVSDVHLGTIISTRQLNRLVKKINAQQPDVVLFAGDIFDEDISSVINNGLGNYFTQINSKYGVYAIPGNHEYFGGIDHKLQYLSDHGVTVLRDSTVLINNDFYVVGRDDRSNSRRKSISELIASSDNNKPFILLDHQPFNLNEAASNKIDLQISGHTHHGQLWPFNYITSAIYEVSSGYKQIGNTHVIVSNGYGSWGPPMRLGNRPEILVIDLKNN